MNHSTPRSGRSAALLLAVLAVAGAIVLGMVLLDSDSGSESPGDQAAVALPAASVLHQGASADPVQIVALTTVAKEQRVEDMQYGPSTVLWPLEVHLDLVRPGLLPDVPGGTPLGSGRTARLRGRLVDLHGAGAVATISFLGGPNSGRVLTTGADGVFGANDLYPGLEVVQIEGPTISGSRREIRLRQGKVMLLNIAYGNPGGAQGRVLDQRNEAVGGATVSIDGQSTLTDPKGNFFLPHIAAGRELLVEIEHPDFARYRGQVGVARSFVAEPGRFVFNLQEPATLVLDLANDIGGPGPAQVVLVPTHGGLNRSFPWYKVNPIELGLQPVTVDRLPSGTFYAYTFRAGAEGDPARTRVTIAAGETRALSVGLTLAPTLRGRVVMDGQVVSGASVELSAADPVRATLDIYRESSIFLESEVLPPLPSVRQRVTTDANGEFVLTSGAARSAYRLLEVIGKDGRHRSVLAVGPETNEIEIELTPVEEGQATLQLLLSNRFQPLPVQIVVNGRPRESFELSPDQDLELDGLASGEWDLRVVWGGDDLIEVKGLELSAIEQRSVTLPDGARSGQDRESWVRAGRTWPLD